MAINDFDDVVRKLEEISDKLGKEPWDFGSDDTVKGKLDDVNYKLDVINVNLNHKIRLLESIETELGRSAN